MAEPRQNIGQQQGDPARDTTEAAPSPESLGEQLLREAREGQAGFVAGWKEFMEELGIQGQPIGARTLRELLLREGFTPNDNEFSKGIIAMREE
jgi:hypothetical protein